jgi:hypothetical protein
VDSIPYLSRWWTGDVSYSYEEMVAALERNDGDIAGNAASIAAIEADYPTSADISGYDNEASNNYAAVSGGRLNEASGQYASVTGGTENFALGNYDAVSGGYRNTAEGQYSTVLVGASNVAGGAMSTVYGGNAQSTSAWYTDAPWSPGWVGREHRGGGRYPLPPPFG